MQFFIHKSIYAFVVVALLATITFFMIRLAPGGPFSQDRSFDPALVKVLNERYHFDKPMIQQYFLYIGGVLSGDFGPSLKQKNRTVREIITRHLPPSLVLGMLALFFAIIIGCVAGLISSLRPNTSWDYWCMGLAVMGISLPAFVFGPLLQMFFSRYLHWFPVAGYGDVSQLILPALTLSLPFAARFARLMRSGMLEVLSQDFIRTARARGVKPFNVIRIHALRGGMLPVLSYLGPAVAAITTGSLVVEQIFAIPGLGREFVQSALNRDYFLVMGTVIVYGTFIVICNLAADMLYAFLDPRVRDRTNG